jgi:hypothetical protein
MSYDFTPNKSIGCGVSGLDMMESKRLGDVRKTQEVYKQSGNVLRDLRPGGATMVVHLS